jgi:hypothetical protein
MKKWKKYWRSGKKLSEHPLARLLLILKVKLAFALL